MAEKKSGGKSGGKPKKKGKKMHELYTLSGEKAARKNRHCPKCGPGTFLGSHSDRMYCGTCHYVEYGKK